MLLSSFSVGHLLFDMLPTLRVVCFPSETPLEKINFSFASGYRLEIGCGLGMGARIHFSFSSGTPSGAYPILAAPVFVPREPALLYLEGLDSLVSSGS